MLSHQLLAELCWWLLQLGGLRVVGVLNNSCSLPPPTPLPPILPFSPGPVSHEDPEGMQDFSLLAWK